MSAARTYAVIDPDTGKIDRSIFSDRAVYDAEMERIFARAWLMIGHESLVARPHDFFHTYMAEDPVILTRPFTVRYPMRHDPTYEWWEYACHEGNTIVPNYVTTSRFERANAKPEPATPIQVESSMSKSGQIDQSHVPMSCL